jgi:hypothetical protein
MENSGKERMRKKQVLSSVSLEQKKLFGAVHVGSSRSRKETGWKCT